MKKPLTLPMDVRLMQWTATLMFALAIIMCLISGMGWLLRHPAFSIQGITVRGNVTHSNAVTLRANVLPQLTGNFFTLNLMQARQAFEQIPWIRSALVRREFPNRLNVTLDEFLPVAQWGNEGDGKFLSAEGAVFEVNADDVDSDTLPTLKGPESQAKTVLEMFHYLKPLMAKMDMNLDKLELSQRGSWSAQLESGATLELGNGSQQEIGSKLQLFFKTLTQVASRYGRTATSLLSADLRYENGYALRLRGVSTLAVDGLKKP
ncbi:MAG: Cell division protein FtsQ [Pseudomonadota bacterium]|jgi:cell division protein FtsQ